MAGWTRAKRVVFEQAFYDFLGCFKISSKDLGQICLGEHIYNAQRRLLTAIFDGLEQDIHSFYCLKSRQLGISTTARALTLFWMGMHPGLRGAMVFDTDENKQAARREIEEGIANLPASMRFPRLIQRNRTSLTIENQSIVYFKAAGISPTRSSGALGASLGLSFMHASEMCSWSNPQGVEALRHSLSEVNQDRFYLWESTARGRNLWHDVWTEAKEDTNHSRCVFIGWWAKESQQIRRSDPDFMRYGEQPPTEQERARIADVKKRYGHDITQEQLAWYRRRMDPNARPEHDDEEPEYQGDILRIQEQAFTEDDAFKFTGVVFFDPQALTEQAESFASKKFDAYVFHPGMEFHRSHYFKAPNPRSTQLKVWEEPGENRTYIISADPAYGHSDTSDRSCCQVLECYADCLVQVAEFASPLVNTKEFAWLIASLMGWYGGTTNSQIFHILEMNGPGNAVWIELQSLQRFVNGGYLSTEMREKGLDNIFHNVRNYIYSRSDAVRPSGASWQWETNQRRKVTIMEILRSMIATGRIEIRSEAAIDEAVTISREGDSIEASPGKKDDRIITLALGAKYWEHHIRRALVAQGRTREAERAKRQATIADQARLFMDNQLQGFFAGQQRRRVMVQRAINRASWRGV